MTLIPAVTEVESPRLRWTEFEHDENPDDGSEVVAGLTATPKTLPYKYFYDDRGSELFVEITRQPEYYPTRTERWILDTHAPDIAATAGAGELLELGSGAADKTRSLIAAMIERGGTLRFLPIDVSGGILRESSRELLETYRDLEIWGLIGTYHQALRGLPEAERGRRLLIFLGSSIGNMTDEEVEGFLDETRAALDPGDHFLVGFDLQKPVEVVEAAYNDRAGVTAAFNLNMLRHLNSRFDGDFDTGRFAHRAFYDRRAHQIEMHLESLADQRVRLAALDLEVDFAAGETVRTEISRKFDPPTVDRRFAARGFAPEARWTDPDGWFALALFARR